MGIDATAATRHLKAADPVMARLIAECGPFEMAPSKAGPFRALTRVSRGGQRPSVVPARQPGIGGTVLRCLPKD